MPGGYPVPSEPGGGDPQDWMRRHLFERRTVLLTGRLDDQASNEAGAALMMLDATGDDAVQLRIDSGDGTVAAGLALMDVIDLLGVPVHAWCTGQAAGPTVGVLAVCHRRLVSPHARLRLVEPAMEAQGRAADLEGLAAAHLERWSAFCARLSQATGRSADAWREDAARGRFLSADEAVELGVAEEVATPDARMYRLPSRSIGFGPR
ncbi:MAG: ATP-dependent Clp protease proteolytic subunit [Acidimicrobiales bacterium]